VTNFSYTVVDCYKRKPILVTKSPSKAKELLEKGIKIEVWHKNNLIQTVYKRSEWLMAAYIEMQENAEDKTKARCKIESHIKDLTPQQYKVLIGLIEHNETQAAMKGLYKILRRNNKEKV
jgi:hypothetical protein